MEKLLEYKKDDLNKLHKVQIEILEEIIRVCDKFSIKWFAAYGTLIGAIRHSGYIPWDDDIDIGMPREDYDKFLRVAPVELNNGFTLSHYTVDKMVPHYFAKVRKDNTLFVEESSKKIKMHHGIFVDIFPYDKVLGEGKKAKKHVSRIFYLNKLFINKSTTIPSDRSNKLSYLVKKSLKIGLRVLTCGFSKKYYYEKLDKLAQKYKDADTDYLVSSGCDKVIIKYSDIFPTVKKKFENIEVKVPRNYEKILNEYFNNYMELPPQEERINHAPQKLKFENK